VQVSLVSHYGPKDKGTGLFLGACQERLSGLLGHVFRPYALEQIHGTILGLEGHRKDDVVLNANSRRPMDTAALLAFLRAPGWPALDIQLGGYGADDDYGFASRGQHPFMRSFSLQGLAAVSIGWPVRDGGYPLALDALRRRFNGFNVLHKWHRTESDVDNDFYLVLGHITQPGLPREAAQHIESQMRQFLSACGPVTLPVSRERLYIVAYTDPQLPLDTTRSFSVPDPGLTGQAILDLYSEEPG